jgi:hypothetical protein
MAKILFRLRGVPDDEAEEVRELLAARGIDHYETPPGNWGISMPAIWLRDESRLDEARALLDEYQRNRQARAREEYDRLKREGRHPQILDKLRQEPLNVVVSLAVVALVLYVSVRLIVDLVNR